jgi:hypothetical protein
MARRKQTAAEFIEENALLVPMILGDMIEHLGNAAQEWSYAVWAARKGDLDKALTHVVEVGIAVDIPLKVGRAELRSISWRAGNPTGRRTARRRRGQRVAQAWLMSQGRATNNGWSDSNNRVELISGIDSWRDQPCTHVRIRQPSVGRRSSAPPSEGPSGWSRHGRTDRRHRLRARSPGSVRR